MRVAPLSSPLRCSVLAGTAVSGSAVTVEYRRTGAQRRTANHARLNELITASPAAPLLEETGFGAYTAAIIISAWSHPGRIRNEAAFAALAGVNPIPASSGNTARHRLGRGGDRRLNKAHHYIAITRMSRHPGTGATATDASRKDAADAKSDAASSATSPEASSAPSTPSMVRLRTKPRLGLRPRSDNRLIKRGGDDVVPE